MSYPEPPNDQRSIVTTLLLRPMARSIEQPIGWLCLLIGVAGAALCIWVSAMALVRPHLPFGVFVVLACVALITCFMSSVGYRLAFDAPNRYGSLTSPGVWMACSLVFGSGAIAFIVAAARGQGGDALVAVISSALLALLAYGAASHFKRKRHPTDLSKRL